MVIHTLPEAKLTPVLEKLSRCDLPALWKPKANQFVHVDSIPTLGTGKMDLRAIRELATSLSAVEVETQAQARG
jgi:acyl-[acyl-carrier-protein]-phospholipid O-acyltransferase/long-chain-fatty-acid--[acyl-carrier-protein] ligase